MSDEIPELTPAQQRFILHWGEMGTRWGVNRTVAQIHALLYLSPRPLNAQEIAQVLSVARSNVSNSLRELHSWGTVRVVHVIGDRRDHFEAMVDAWEMFRVILDERKRREIDPTLAFLRENVRQLEQPTDDADAYTHQRLKEMLGIFESASSVYAVLRAIPLERLQGLASSSSKLKRILGAQT